MDLQRVTACEPDVEALLTSHFNLMRAQSPPDSCHVLPAKAMSAPDIYLYALREHGRALAIGALRVEGATAELKSMHTAAAARGRGLGRRLLHALIDEAREMGLVHLQLETGSGVEHRAARRLYASEGFVPCAPFGHYTEDPLSLFYERAL